MFDFIFDKKAFMAVKEKLDRSKFFHDGEKEKLTIKPPADAFPAGQKTDKIADKFVESGPKEKLLFPAVKQEAAMNKEAAQQLPGSDKIDAGGKQFVEGGEKGKLQFPGKPGPDPKIKGPEVSHDAEKQVEPGEKGKLQFPSSGGPKIKIEWQVNVDQSITKKFTEAGEKGDIKKAPAHAKEPSVSAQKDNAHLAKVTDGGEHAKPFQKQFSLNFVRATVEEKDAAVVEAIDNSILELEVAASKCGVKLSATRLAAAYTALQDLRAGVVKNGSLYALTPEPAPAPAPLKVQASAVNDDPEGLKSAAEIGRLIF